MDVFNLFLKIGINIKILWNDGYNKQYIWCITYLGRYLDGV